MVHMKNLFAEKFAFQRYMMIISIKIYDSYREQIKDQRFFDYRRVIENAYKRCRLNRGLSGIHEFPRSF